MADFIPLATLKSDVFSRTVKGHFADAPDRPVIRRIVSAAPWWSRPLAWFLARREIAALRAVSGIPGAPQLLVVDRDGLYRTWSEGAPLHLARPGDPAFFRSAFALLRALRRLGITHNDLAKPQNWLMTPDGQAAIIDFQLASVHRRRGALYRMMAYEDLRHLLKQKRAFAPALLTPTAERLLARRSMPSRLWRATGKRVYNLVTRGVFNWSDGEGTGDRIEREGEATIAALSVGSGVSAVALSVYPLAGGGVGLYAFVEAAEAVDQAALARAHRRRGGSADLVQIVAKLPRDASGQVRDDLLHLVAMNRADEIEAQMRGDPALEAVMTPILASRLNLGDRRIARLEK